VFSSWTAFVLGRTGGEWSSGGVGWWEWSPGEAYPYAPFFLHIFLCNVGIPGKSEFQVSVCDDSKENFCWCSKSNGEPGGRGRIIHMGDDSKENFCWCSKSNGEPGGRGRIIHMEQRKWTDFFIVLNLL
jgi:hypothetical protein